MCHPPRPRRLENMAYCCQATKIVCASTTSVIVLLGSHVMPRTVVSIAPCQYLRAMPTRYPKFFTVSSILCSHDHLAYSQKWLRAKTGRPMHGMTSTEINGHASTNACCKLIQVNSNIESHSSTWKKPRSWSRQSMPVYRTTHNAFTAPLVISRYVKIINKRREPK